MSLEPLLCSQGGIPYNKAHLDAKDAEIERLRADKAELLAALHKIAQTSLDATSVSIAMDAIAKVSK